MLPIILGLWIVTGVQRAIGAYMGYGRNLFVRRVQLEAERRLLEQASKVDLGHFDNSDWHDRLARAKRDVSWRPGDLTWSVLGLSGNIVTIVLMAGLLASLHYVLVVLALAAALLSLVLERRVTAKLYEFFYKETPEEREREYLGDLLVQPRTTKEIRAYVLADYLLGRHRDRSEDLFRQREQMYRSGTRISMLTGLVTGTALALAYVFVAMQGMAGTIDPGGVVLVIGAFTSVSRHARQHLEHVRRGRSAHDVPRRLLLVPGDRSAGAGAGAAARRAAGRSRRDRVRRRDVRVSGRDRAGGRRISACTFAAGS